jgi:hypothetical protein
MFKKFVIGILLVIGLSACTPANPFEGYDEIDLVLISDSSGWNVAGIYAGYLEEDLGIKVNVHDYANVPDTAREVLLALNGEGESRGNLMMDKLPDVIKEAEIVIFYHNPEGSGLSQDVGCIPPQFYAPDEISPELFAPYQADLEAIYEEIFALRSEEPIMVLAFDAYFPYYYWWEEAGVFDQCLTYWELYNQAIHAAAEKYDIPVAPVFDTFNGENHDQIPFDNGLISPDKMHTTPEGAKLIADLLWDLGIKANSH